MRRRCSFKLFSMLDTSHCYLLALKIAEVTIKLPKPCNASIYIESLKLLLILNPHPHPMR